MFKGWWAAICHGRTCFGRPNADEIDGIQTKWQASARRPVSTNKPYTSTAPASKDPPWSSEAPPMPRGGVLPDPLDSRKPNVRQPSYPVAGEVTKRHETTTWFDDASDEEQPSNSIRGAARRHGATSWFEEASDEEELQPIRRKEVEKIVSGIDPRMGGFDNGNFSKK